ncbi:MAG: UDP-N-acetylglucosamine 2-epimerase (non-hydrolyzing) [Synergistales bacterium]|nr:UDP-N-acetylglucosamine 2-epimerase (non-hydrolyzing) [Synergistales bacterium]MDY6401231.1 UDP-N-acetylglucosamine 2-epimerase (non-hydrolyzing) [Synergistales bacterium]MDY6404429.1 UDP-N-acetylglucosamine 2-epimerase (non-hydrolyzing) [Synergistales bacterium]MDY6410212.1 UDP-N-acetylglucosamine 2-epimerase (non-hydrolyzing) [Synergistales bacterium]MDY6414964.1 UDP-N-acetylglucosamine 2-epimerase (non-hydrolyzing) [Synergistales bacterium]
MKNITCVTGTRPEAIKMAPVILELKKNPDFKVTTLATGQHTDMLRQALKDFGITPDVDLNIMKQAQTLDYITSSVLQGVGKFLDENPQDMILVHGDTSTTFAAALAGFYRHVPVGHVEAGLRSHNLALPFPEEANRILTDGIADLFFAPTEGDAENLRSEGKSKNIFITGNTVIDALYNILERSKAKSEPEYMQKINDRPMILMTAHRRESWGKTLEGICAAVADVIKNRNDVIFLIPLHKNPVVRDVIKNSLKDFTENVIFTEPLNYPEFVYAMNKSIFILSDSGGVQEEASAINKPVLIMRTLSERPEAITHGTCILVGTDRDNIRSESLKILNEPEYLKAIIAKNKMPFGNGTASKKIHEAVKEFLK